MGNKEFDNNVDVAHCVQLQKHARGLLCAPSEKTALLSEKAQFQNWIASAEPRNDNIFLLLFFDTIVIIEQLINRKKNVYKES